MTGSRNRPRRIPGPLLGAVLLLLFGAVAPREAAAQVGQPLQLAPPESEAPDTGGAATNRSTPAEDSSDRELPGAGVEGIEVDRLEELNPETIGILDPGADGLGPEMWAGTPRHVVEALLPHISGTLASPTLRGLARRLLLSSSAPPARRQASDSRKGSLLNLRAGRLAALGEMAGLAELLRVVPRRFHDDALSRRRAEALFLTGRTQQACQVVQRALENSQARYWEKALAVCQVATDARQQASLTATLLRETGGADGSGFLRVFDALDAGNADSLDLETLEPLSVALLLAGGAAPPEGAWRSGGMAVALALAEDGSAPLPQRLRAAELAASRGALPPEKLRSLYMAHEAGDAATDPDGAPDALARAGLYQAVRQAATQAERVDGLRRLFEATPPRLYLAMSRVAAPFLVNVEPRAGLAGFAALAGRALYAADRREAADRWLTMAQEESIINPEAAAAVTALWPYARLSGAAEVPVNGGLAAWRSAHAAPEPEVARRESLLRAAFQALGERDERVWIEIAADAPLPARPMPAAARVYALREAGEAGRVGEVVLLALVTLGESGLGACHPMLLGTALAALSQVGLEAEARRLAVEAALVNGI